MKRTNNAIAIAAALMLLIGALGMAYQQSERRGPGVEIKW